MQVSQANPWRFRHQPALVAHRGFARLFPENTLTAIVAAVDAGARFIEFDIQLSKDRIPFLMHDENFERTAGINKPVFETTMQEIHNLSIGEASRLGGRFVGVKPITLEHLITHLNHWPDIHSFVEIKRESIEHFGFECVMQQVFVPLSNLTAPFTVLSFVDEVVEYTKRHSHYSSGWVIRDWNEASFNTLKALKPDFVYCNYKKIPNDTELPSGSWKWVLYEITDVDVARHWQSKGVDMIESMAVGSMLNSGIFGPIDALVAK